MAREYRTKEERNKRRKKKKIKKTIFLVLILVALAVILIFALKNHDEPKPADTDLTDTSLEEVISTETDSQGEEPVLSTETSDEIGEADQNAGQNDGQNDEKNAEQNTEQNTEDGSEKTVTSDAVSVHPKEYSFPSNAPKKGENKTVMGLPKLQEVRLKDDGDLLVLVNKYHAVSAEYYPADMVKVDPSLGTWDDLTLKSECYEAYKKMYNDAKEKGFNLKLCSAYRTYNTQVSLFNSSLSSYGWDTTYIRSAYPGRSEHHTGLAIDITSKSMGWGLTQDFADYEDGKWLNENCQNYGFILRYPEGSTEITGYMYEPWHFRYVGVEVAKEIMEKGITLEEYLGKD